MSQKDEGRAWSDAGSHGSCQSQERLLLRGSGEQGPADALISDFRPLELGENMCFKHPVCGTSSQQPQETARFLNTGKTFLRMAIVFAFMTGNVVLGKHTVLSVTPFPLHYYAKQLCPQASIFPIQRQ